MIYNVINIKILMNSNNIIYNMTWGRGAAINSRYEELANVDLY
jgi:hypothetical protein